MLTTANLWPRTSFAHTAAEAAAYTKPPLLPEAGRRCSRQREQNVCRAATSQEASAQRSTHRPKHTRWLEAHESNGERDMVDGERDGSGEGKQKERRGGREAESENTVK